MERIATSIMFVGDQHGKAEEAIRLYVSLFENSRLNHVERYSTEEEHDGIKHAHFELAGRDFTAMDGGRAHNFNFTPAVSLSVIFDERERLDAAFAALSEDGAVLMPLGEYEFNPRFGWLNDRFGVSWQLMLANA